MKSNLDVHEYFEHKIRKNDSKTLIGLDHSFLSDKESSGKVVRKKLNSEVNTIKRKPRKNSNCFKYPKLIRLQERYGNTTPEGITFTSDSEECVSNEATNEIDFTESNKTKEQT